MRHIPFAGFIWVRCVLAHSQIAGCRRAGQVRPHRTARRHGERGATMTPAGLMTGGGPPRRTGGVAGSPGLHSSALQHLSPRRLPGRPGPR
jgi:hypothetical protein